MALSVRPSLVEDAPTIAHIRIATWRSAYRGIVPAAVLDNLSVDRATGFFEGCIADPDSPNRLLSGFADDTLRGFALWNPHSEAPEYTAELRALYVLDQWQRSGLGRALLDAARRAMAAAGYRDMAVFTLEANRPARTFYERLGGEPLPYTRLFEVDGAVLPEVGYRFALQPL